MASIVTDNSLKNFTKNVLKTYIVPNMKKINDEELTSLYEEKKQEYQNILTNSKFDYD